MGVSEKRISNSAYDDHEKNAAPHDQQGALTSSPCRRSVGAYRDDGEDVSNGKRREADQHGKKHHLAALPSAGKHVKEREEKSHENKSASATKRATSSRTGRGILNCWFCAHCAEDAGVQVQAKTLAGANVDRGGEV